MSTTEIISAIKESTERVDRATLWLILNQAIKNPDPEVIDAFLEQASE